MKIHVFAIDALPSATVSSSGGGLRSQQIITGLEKAGATVSYSEPFRADDVRKQWDNISPAQQKLAFDFGYEGKRDRRTATDIIDRVKPDMAVFLWPTLFTIPRSFRSPTINVYDINGLQNIESAMIDPRSASTYDIIRQSTISLIRKMTSADALIAGSYQQKAYWSGLYSFIQSDIHAPEMVTIPFYPTQTPHIVDYVAEESGPLFVVTGSFLPWNSPGEPLGILVEEIEAAGKGRILIVGKANPFLPHALGVNRSLNEFAEKPFVEWHPSMNFSHLSDRMNGRAIGFDLQPRNLERELALPIRTVTYLTHGMPILTNDFCSVAPVIAKYDAGWLLHEGEDLRQKIRAILHTDAVSLAQKSHAARVAARDAYGDTSGFAALVQKSEAMLASRDKGAEPSSRSEMLALSAKRTAPVVLIVTDDHENFLQLRVRIPFDAMYRAGVIDGYHVVSRGKILWSMGSRREIDKIDVVWVQRGPMFSIDAVIDMFDGKFIYDIDDNLLVSPSYRPPFGKDWCDVIRRTLASAKHVMTTTPRLAASLQENSGVQIEHKISFAPNVAELATPRQFSGKPNSLVIASSDAFALTTSRDSFFRAINAFMRANDLPLVYLGPEINALREIEGKVIRPGMMDYLHYKDFLRADNTMAIAPLETQGDPVTSEFVNCKSDIKMVDYGSCGVPGVYADASPFRDSPLEGGPLVDCSDAKAIYDSLDHVYNNADKVARTAYEKVADLRLASKAAVTMWSVALDDARLPVPMPLADIVTRILFNLSAATGKVMVPESMFNGDDYIAMNPDVANAVAAGATTPYAHFSEYGWKEGRSWFPAMIADNRAHGMMTRARDFILTEPARLTELEERVSAALLK